MNRTFLNFEATVNSSGRDDQGQDVYVVRLYVNHHVVAHWELGLREGYLLTQDRAHLDAFVARKMFEMLHPLVITVRDVVPS